jgi:hypothetical protein
MDVSDEQRHKHMDSTCLPTQQTADPLGSQQQAYLQPPHGEVWFVTRTNRILRDPTECLSLQLTGETVLVSVKFCSVLLETQKFCFIRFYTLQILIFLIFWASCEQQSEGKMQRTWIFKQMIRHSDRLCGLVVRVPSCRSRGSGSIPGGTRFSEKLWVHSVSWVQLRSYWKEK